MRKYTTILEGTSLLYAWQASVRVLYPVIARNWTNARLAKILIQFPPFRHFIRCLQRRGFIRIQREW